MSQAAAKVKDRLAGVADAYAHLVEAAAVRYRGPDTSRATIVVHDDMKLLAEGLLLRAHVALESFARELFIEILEGKHPAVTSVASGLTSAQAADLLYVNATQKRLDWLPIEKTMERAAVLLTANDPFSRLSYRPVPLQSLQRMFATRNMVAHSGEEAEKKYRRIVTREAALAEPGAWLLSPSSSSPSVNNLQAILTVLDKVVQALTDPAPNITSLLGTADHLEVGREVIPAPYRCTNCSAVTTTAQYKDSLPGCPACIAAGRPNKWQIAW